MDWDTIVASFYGIGYKLLGDDGENMSWQEFMAVLSGLGPDSPLGRLVSMRLENDPERLKRYTPQMKKERAEWKMFWAGKVKEKMDAMTPEQKEEMKRRKMEAFKAVSQAFKK